MKAMILAAGLGSRLRPLTIDRPKALIEVGGRPLLEHVIRRLVTAGVSEIVINLHHFPEQIEHFLAEKRYFGLTIHFSHEENLLDTGGALKKAAPYLQGNEPFFLHNVDILSTIDLKEMHRFHLEQANLATLAVKHRKTSRYLLFDQKGYLCGRKNREGRSAELVRQPIGDTEALGFCGVHVISPEIFPKIVENGAFSVIDLYLRLSATGEKIRAFLADDYDWRDMGKLNQFKINET